MRDFITNAELEPPVVPSLVKVSEELTNEAEEGDEEKDITIEELHDMYYDMFAVGIEAIEDQLTGGK